jgi:very-short-patch-repair endonuclease
VTVRGRWKCRTAGIRVYATRSLDRADIAHTRGIPCTSVERTLIDIAGGPWAEVERAVEQAFALHLLGRNRMIAALDRANGRRGVGDLRRLLAHLLDDIPLTRSELERRFLKLVARAGLPAPIVNRHRAEHRVDFTWRNHRLVVETDGRATHDNPYGFHHDRARDLDLELAGWHVIRLSWWQVVGEPARVVELLAKRLAEAA